jgi:hypothetical protein
MGIPQRCDHWRRIEELFYAALDLDPKTRSGFLARVCGCNLRNTNKSSQIG